MIVKQRPEDFRVEELTDVRPEAAGPFALYRLVKTGWTTPDALAAIQRRWKIDRARLSYGGLKDRHAQTTQFFSIHHGPARKLSHERISVEYIGQLHEPYSSHHIRANRFHLVVRGLNSPDVNYADLALANVARFGVPNYFDDQRFGSVRSGEPFIARLLIAGDFEAALKSALSAPYEFDRAPQKKEKALLRNLWGDWPVLMNQLPRGHARSLVSYLVHHPHDFRGAVLRLRSDLRGLYLSAYQSHLWNRILAAWIEATLPAETLRPIALCLGDVPAPETLDDATRDRLAQTAIPLPSARTRLADDDPLVPFINRILAEDGLTLAEMQIKGVREMFFSKGDRAALVIPERLHHSHADDDLRPGKKKLTLAFDLPRGSYATMILKRISISRTHRTEWNDA